MKKFAILMVLALALAGCQDSKLAQREKGLMQKFGEGGIYENGITKEQILEEIKGVGKDLLQDIEKLPSSEVVEEVKGMLKEVENIPIENIVDNAGKFLKDVIKK